MTKDQLHITMIFTVALVIVVFALSVATIIITAISGTTGMKAILIPIGFIFLAMSIASLAGLKTVLRRMGMI